MFAHGALAEQLCGCGDLRLGHRETPAFLAAESGMRVKSFGRYNTGWSCDVFSVLYHQAFSLISVLICAVR